MSNNNNSNDENIKNVNKLPLTDYETLYKIELNFDADVSEMNDTVLTNYIAKVIQGHPYYVSIENVVDIIVEEESNKITLIISNREVGDHIVNTTNNNANEINNMYNNDAPVSNKTQDKINLINANYKDKKYILEHSDENGEPVMYEYEFKGFNKAKNLFREESVKLNGNKTRHFLRNDNGKPFFYDEYMNSQIEFSPDNRLNYLSKRIKSLEDRLQHEEVDATNPDVVRRLAQKAVSRVPASNTVTTAVLNFSSVNDNTSNLLPSEMVQETGVGTMQVNGKSNIAGVNNELLNNTKSVFNNNVVLRNNVTNQVDTNMIQNIQQVNQTNNGKTVPSQNTENNITFRSLNNNTINNVNLNANANTITVPVNTENMSDDEFENVTLQITNVVNTNMLQTNRVNGNANGNASTNSVNRNANVSATTNSVNRNANASTNSVNRNANANVNANNINLNNLSNVDEDNISDVDLDNELKNIITEIKNIDETRESKNYKITIGIILGILLLILISVIVYFLVSKKEYLNNGPEANQTLMETIKNNIPSFKK